ncbi:MAG: helix-turn-helix domain-containing protein [Lachnospiraceae bacterium]|nr:helix-turn-helix domain-containing protein [Lachnospiraceae bacterium]
MSKTNKMDYYEFGNRVCEYRNKMHITQEMLAEKVGLSANTISSLISLLSAMGTSMESLGKSAYGTRDEEYLMLHYHKCTSEQQNVLIEICRLFTQDTDRNRRTVCGYVERD